MLSSPLNQLALAAAFAATLSAAGVVPDTAPQRTPWTSNRVAGSPNPPAPYTVERLFPRLTFEHPVDCSLVPDTTRLMVADQAGRMWSFDVRGNAAGADPALDLRRHHRPLDNILGFAFHPGFSSNRYVFINYNEPGGRTNGAIVSRFRVETLDPPRIDPASEVILLRWLSGGHNGCTLAFGNDGYLYASAGDAANPDPPDFPYRTGQDIGDLLASILRIDVDHTNATAAYTIPADNPFVHFPGARPEVYAFGFRNPFRMSFDRPTGDLWVGDVGWEQWEMIDRVVKGGNYGWSLVEGPNPHVRTDVTPGPGPILPPVIALPHTEAASITGGRVYHGRRLSELVGAYLYGDWETGKFWALRHRDGKLLSNQELCDTALKPVAFTQDADGELLILDYNGGLYRLVPRPALQSTHPFPRRLSETGLFASLEPWAPARGTVGYHIQAPMWNDGATAEWLLGVPGTEAIVTQGGVGNIAGSTWYFPSNTVLARTLTLEMERGRAASRRRIETQLLHWDGQSWNPYSYRWNQEQTEGELVSAAGTNTVLDVTDPSAPGGLRKIPWRFAARTECLRCHNAWAGETLTLNWLQLGLTPRRPTGTTSKASELARLSSLGVLQIRDQPADLPELQNPSDSEGPLAARARAWLHVNCSTCHRFGAGGTAAIHLNLEKPLAEMRAVEERPLRGDFSLVGARIIAPGDPYRSALFFRIATESGGHMPHIGSRLVDPSGSALVRDWIRSLQPLAADATAAAAEPGHVLEAENARLVRQLGSAADRRAAVGLLLGTVNGALALLDALTEPEPRRSNSGLDAGSDWRQLRTAAAYAAAIHTNAFVRDLFQRLLPPGERRQTVGVNVEPSEILALVGSADRGREVFHGIAQCSSCHACEGRGRAFGPDLTLVGTKYVRSQLLEQILWPSKLIAPEYKTHSVTLRDGTELRGFLVRRSPTEVSLRDETLQEHTVPLTQIKETYESTVSAMPDGLLAPLTAQEAADLIQYLASPKANSAIK